jgi:hypothetical protein
VDAEQREPGGGAALGPEREGLDEEDRLDQ